MLISTRNVSTTVLLMVRSNLAGSVSGRTPTSPKATCPNSSKLKTQIFSLNSSRFQSAALKPAPKCVIFRRCALVTRFLIKLDSVFSKSKFWKIQNWDLRKEISSMEPNLLMMIGFFLDVWIHRTRFPDEFQVYKQIFEKP